VAQKGICSFSKIKVNFSRTKFAMTFLCLKNSKARVIAKAFAYLIDISTNTNPSTYNEASKLHTTLKLLIMFYDTKLTKTNQYSEIVVRTNEWITCDV